MERKNHIFSKIMLLLVFFFLGCGAMTFFVYKFPSIFKIKTTELKKDVTITDEGIADAVEKVYDAVVVVSTYKNNTPYASGTGFVFKVDGNKAYVLTNNHVIEEGSKITLTFTNNEVIEAELVGTNVLTDIAVLSVPSKDIISVAEIGDSEKTKIGDTSFAVGAPLDSVYSWTVTRGIISGKDRMIEVNLSSSNGEYVMKVIQTDAAINSGNSGGPLCNSNGEVIGITSLKLIDESVEGMGFAIPIEIATEYAEKIIKGETITQPYMGVSMINVTDAYYRQGYYSLVKDKVTSGVVITSVEKGSPAHEGGLEAGDVIIQLNDDNVTSIAYLRYYLYNYEPGDKIKITYLRNGDEKTTTITLKANAKVY